MTKANFLGLGGQKCASSWVYHVLNDHPQVFMSEPKELDFFSYYYFKGHAWYDTHFSRAGTAKAIGEVSPSYFCDPLAPKRVYNYDPEMKLILSLRDPVDRAYSCHLYSIQQGFLEGADLLFETGMQSNSMYIFQSLYGAHIENWLRVFPRHQILVLFQENIPKDPQDHARRMYEFLDVDPDFQSSFLFKRANESIGSHDQVLFNAWRMVGDMGRRCGLGAIVEGVKRLPPVAAAMAGYRRDLRVEIPDMCDETKQGLRQEFHDDLLKLARLLDRSDFPWPSWRAILDERDKSPARLQLK